MNKKYEDIPFPLAYLDWCKEKGLKSVKETENKELIRQFYREIWQPLGKEVNGLDYGIAMGLI